MRNKLSHFAIPYVVWMALFVVAPLVIITVYAFTSDAGGFTLANFQDMAQYTAAFGRSFLLAAIATVICVLIGYPLAYFLARETSWVHRMATMLIMLPMWMNFLLRTYSWKFLLERNGLINTLFGLFGVGPFQMIDTQGAIVLGMVYNFLPYMVLPIFSVIEKIDPKVIEAAQDLGANDRTVFRRIVFPLSLTGVLSGITMVFIPSVSTFAISRLLGGSKTAEWALVIVAGICMTASAYFGIKSLTIVSYIAVPMVAVLGTVAMILAVMRGDGTIVDQFAKSSGTLTVVGGAGLVIGSFVSGGTATPNFSRFARNGKIGAITTVIAFFIGNSLMFFFGGISSVYVGGNDIFEVMINLGLFYLAILVLGLNIWTTNDNALYSAGLGLANIFGQRKKPMVLVSGIIGTVLAVWLYWNFTGWLNILNCTLPPVGIILVMSFFMDREKYKDVEVTENVNWFAVFGVVLGAVVANLVPWGIASINGMIVAAVCYLVGSKAKK